MTKKKSLFVTFEGGEGAGKSTLIKKIASSLQEKGYETLLTREPGGTKLGETVREWLLHRSSAIELCDRAELLLFLAARAQHIDEVILPALGQGKIVLCDRFNDSSVVYQGAARNLGIDVVKRESLFACNGLSPDITLFLDIDPAIGLERTRKLTKESAAAGEVDRIEAEKLSFHTAVREGMLQLAREEPHRINAIDAAQPPETVFQTAYALIMEKMKREEKEP